jgi:hypothetical protein
MGINKGGSIMIDQGNMCLWCRKDTHLGSGNFVNRFPAETDTEIGYKCDECENETRLECYKICLNCNFETCEGDSECIECGGVEFRELTKEDL